MVLQDASSSPPSDFTSDSNPSSDLDPYAGSNPEYTETRPSNYVRVNETDPPVYVNISNIPAPFFTSNTNATVRRSLERQLPEIMQNAAKAAGRPVTQQEAEAIAYHHGAGGRIGMLGQPIGILLGVAQFARGMKSFRFPFVNIFKNGMRSPDRLGPFQGTQARLGWHFLRLSAYAFVGGQVGDVFFKIYGISTGVSGRLKDPKLKELNEAIGQRAKQNRQQSLEGAMEQRRSREEESRANQRGESVDMWKMRQKQAESDQRSRLQNRAQNDDMSPTGGAFQEELNMQSDSFVKDDWQAPQETQPWQSSSSSPGAATTAATSRNNQTSNTNTNANTNTNTQRSTSTSTQHSSTSSQTGSGSAWERLRRNAMSGADRSNSSSSQSSRPSTSSSSQSSSSSGDDSFSFSQNYEDKQLARSEAQKEFDARIEREREGKDFDDGSSRTGKKW